MRWAVVDSGGGGNSPGETHSLVCSCSCSCSCFQRHRCLWIGRHHHHHCWISCCRHCCVLEVAWHHWGWGGSVIGVEVVASLWLTTVAAVTSRWAWWWWWWEGKGWRASVWTSVTWFGKWWAMALALVICWLYFPYLKMLLWCSLLECWAIKLCGLGFNSWTLHFFFSLLLILNIIQYN